MLTVVVAISTIMKALRQPLIIGYIVSGVLIGPYVFGFFESSEVSDLLSRFGIALLLFIIGIGLNPRVIKDVGKVALVTGLGQITFTALLGYFASRYFGFSSTESIFLAFGIAFSSTIVALKVISDKHENAQLYAKIVTGFLLVQDIVATILLIITAASGEGGASSDLVQTIGLSVLLASGLFLAAVFVLPRVEKFVSGAQEYLFLFSIAWGFGIASLFALSGLSIEVGALFAGIALAAQPYALEVASRLRPLRDFFVMLFFVILGAELAIDQFQGDLLPAVAGLSLLVLITNPLTIMLLMGVLGYTKKTSFKASLTVSQISEFSLIFVILGASVGKIGQDVVSVITMVALVTIGISAYLMLFDEKLYAWFEKYLTLFERKKLRDETRSKHKADILLFGYKRGGKELIPTLEKLKRKFLVVDYDPEVVDDLRHDNIPFAYGDASDAEFLRELDMESAHMIISSASDFRTNLFLTTEARALNDKAIIIVHADQPEEAIQLYEYGATYVTMPRYISSERVGRMISRSGLRKSKFDKAKESHLHYVQRHLV